MNKFQITALSLLMSMAPNFALAATAAGPQCVHATLSQSELTAKTEEYAARIAAKGLVSLTDAERADLHSLILTMNLGGRAGGSLMDPNSSSKLVPPQAGLVFAPASRWRKNLTNAQTDITDLSLDAEQDLRAQVRELTRGIVEESYAAEMDAMIITGTKNGQVKTVIDRGAYGTHISPRYELSGVDPSGKVRMILMLTTSGHDVQSGGNMTQEQIDRAEHQREARVFGWSLNDKYGIRTTDGNNQNSTWIVQNAPSRDVTTIQEIDVTLVPGKVLKVKYERGGSAGADAYAEARVIELIWNPK